MILLQPLSASNNNSVKVGAWRSSTKLMLKFWLLFLCAGLMWLSAVHECNSHAQKTTFHSTLPHPLLSIFLVQKKFRVWRGRCLALKCTGCSSRGPRFDSQHPLGHYICNYSSKGYKNFSSFRRGQTFTW